MRVLVVGATGALRPAAQTLVRARHTVYALSRTPGDPRRGLVAVAADYTDLPGLRSALATLPRFDAALMYAPAASDDARRVIADAVDGTVVELLTSEHADPVLNPSADPALTTSVGVPLLLGWTADAGRWHTAQELSDAALAVLADPSPGLLGTVRPWSRRPG